MSTRDGGSKHNNSTFFRVDSDFNKTYKLENLVSVMYEQDHVPNWDPMISHNEFHPLKDGDKTIGTNWTKHHRIMHMSSRDYCDKMINFYHNGKFYHYQTSIPACECHKVKELNGDVVRGTTIYNIGMIHRDEESGKLHYHGLIQLDCKV